MILILLLLLLLTISVVAYFTMSSDEPETEPETEPEIEPETETEPETEPEPEPVWTVTSTLNPKGSKGDNEFDETCKNSYVDNINVHYGGLLDGVQLQCSDGTKLNLMGVKSGKEGKLYSKDGFNELSIKHGGVIDNINKGSQVFGGSGGSPHTFKCKEDEKIMGMYGTHGYYSSWDVINNLGVKCGKLLKPSE
jgi:hypothetical protein